MVRRRGGRSRLSARFRSPQECKAPPLNRQKKRKRRSISITKMAAEDAFLAISNMAAADAFISIAPHLSPIKPNGPNVVFSPLSLRVVVSLIAAGASGPTLQQLLAFLKSESIDDVNKLSSELVWSVFADKPDVGGPKISFINGIWINEGLSLKRSYKQVVDNVYKTHSYRADFANRASKIVSEVNSWAEEHTDGLVKKILDPGSVDETTRLILADALYFKGSWDEKYFDASKTKEDDFHLLGGNSVKVPFMTTSWKQSISSFEGFKVLRLPYDQGGYDNDRLFSMYILLPDSNDGLRDLVEKVCSEPGFIDRHTPERQVKVKRFKLPKFKISFGFTASETLKQLGVSSPFKAGGLTGMVDSAEEGELLSVSGIYQKSVIEVNEQGTEAAAVTAVGLIGARRGRHPPTPEIDFVADHPFMFLIREDNTGAVLFFGHVLNPLKE